MLIKKLFFVLLFVNITLNIRAFQWFEQKNDIYLYGQESDQMRAVMSMLKKFEIKFRLVDSISDNNHLYILFNLADIDEKILPKYYVAFQSLDLTHGALEQSYALKLVNAIVVWDYDQKNIEKYKSNLPHYYYLPVDYEYAPALLLVCFIPLELLPTYKETVKLSNELTGWPVSSHFPLFFTYSLLQKPRVAVEAGVTFAISTMAFEKAFAINECQEFFGIDTVILPSAQTVYSRIKNATLLNMDDRLFSDYYKKNNGHRSDGLDFVFIDTSHEYEHTLQELGLFVDLLARDGVLMLHDSNIAPDEGGTVYTCINGDKIVAHCTDRGVARALKEFFNYEFNEYKYQDVVFRDLHGLWHMVHYPFCNGLTVFKLLEKTRR